MANSQLPHVLITATDASIVVADGDSLSMTRHHRQTDTLNSQNKATDDSHSLKMLSMKFDPIKFRVALADPALLQPLRQTQVTERLQRRKAQETLLLYAAQERQANR